MAVKAQIPVAQQLAATKARTFRSFLLMEQFAAQEIGARIKEARLEAGLTQEQLAEIASFSKRSLQDYEMGVTIPYKHMAEISRLLRRPVEWFLHGTVSEADDRLEGLEGLVVQGFAAVDRRLSRLEERLLPEADQETEEQG